MTDEEWDGKLLAYLRALQLLHYEDREDKAKQARYRNFPRGGKTKKINWIRWVEANVESVDWCSELFHTAIRIGLGVKS